MLNYQVIKLKAFQPFTNTAGALEEINAVSEGLMTDNLKDFLTRNLPKTKEGKKAKYALGLVDPKLANAVHEGTGIKCVCDELVCYALAFLFRVCLITGNHH